MRPGGARFPDAAFLFGGAKTDDVEALTYREKDVESKRLNQKRVVEDHMRFESNQSVTLRRYDAVSTFFGWVTGIVATVLGLAALLLANVVFGVSWIESEIDGGWVLVWLALSAVGGMMVLVISRDESEPSIIPIGFGVIAIISWVIAGGYLYFREPSPSFEKGQVRLLHTGDLVEKNQDLKRGVFVPRSLILNLEKTVDVSFVQTLGTQRARGTTRINVRIITGPALQAEIHSLWKERRATLADVNDQLWKKAERAVHEAISKKIYEENVGILDIVGRSVVTSIPWIRISDVAGAKLSIGGDL